MNDLKKVCCWLFALIITCPLVSIASTPVKSIIVFGDSLSDTGNTTHLLKSLRQEEDPAFLVAPFKLFVMNKMVEYADDYYVPQIVLDAGLKVVTDFFDNELAPYIVNLIAKVKMVPILPGKPYWNDRFSNGRVWNEYLAQMLSLPNPKEDHFNMAFGGAWAATYNHHLTVWNLIRHPLGTIKALIVGKLIPPSLGFIVQGYLMNHEQLDKHKVYFIFAGGNDYLNVLLFEENYNTAVMSNYIDNVVSSIGSVVLKLEQAGAKHFVVMGIPHLGLTPRFLNTTDREVINAAVDEHNKRLAAYVDEWSQQYPEADFLFIDTAQYMAKALASPEKYGFSNVAEACIDVKFPMYQALANSPFAGNFVLQYAQLLQYRHPSFAPGEKNYNVCDNPENYLFWDDIHPTTRAHKYLAFEICSAMKEHGYAVTCEQPNAAVAGYFEKTALREQ